MTVDELKQSVARLRKVMTAPVSNVYPHAMNGGRAGLKADLAVVLAALGAPTPKPDEGVRKCAYHHTGPDVCVPASAKPDEGWLPIESAPKDGGRMVLWGRIAVPGTAFDEACVGAWSNTLGCWLRSGVMFKATHWRPLPAAPKPDRAGGV